MAAHKFVRVLADEPFTAPPPLICEKCRTVFGSIRTLEVRQEEGGEKYAVIVLRPLWLDVYPAIYNGISPIGDL